MIRFDLFVLIHFFVSNFSRRRIDTRSQFRRLLTMIFRHFPFNLYLTLIELQRIWFDASFWHAVICLIIVNRRERGESLAIYIIKTLVSFSRFAVTKRDLRDTRIRAWTGFSPTIRRPHSNKEDRRGFEKKVWLEFVDLVIVSKLHARASERSELHLFVKVCHFILVDLVQIHQVGNFGTQKSRELNCRVLNCNSEIFNCKISPDIFPSTHWWRYLSAVKENIDRRLDLSAELFSVPYNLRRNKKTQSSNVKREKQAIINWQQLRRIKFSTGLPGRHPLLFFKYFVFLPHRFSGLCLSRSLLFMAVNEREAAWSERLTRLHPFPFKAIQPSGFLFTFLSGDIELVWKISPLSVSGFSRRMHTL